METLELRCRFTITAKAARLAEKHGIVLGDGDRTVAVDLAGFDRAGLGYRPGCPEVSGTVYARVAGTPVVDRSWGE